MGRGAQCDGTDVLWMRLHRNGAAAIALQTSAVRQIIRARVSLRKLMECQSKPGAAIAGPLRGYLCRAYHRCESWAVKSCSSGFGSSLMARRAYWHSEDFEIEA